MRINDKACLYNAVGSIFSVPQDLSYLKEDSGLRTLFLVLQEESCKGTYSTYDRRWEVYCELRT